MIETTVEKGKDLSPSANQAWMEVTVLCRERRALVTQCQPGMEVPSDKIFFAQLDMPATHMYHKNTTTSNMRF